MQQLLLQRLLLERKLKVVSTLRVLEIQMLDFLSAVVLFPVMKLLVLLQEVEVFLFTELTA